MGKPSKQVMDFMQKYGVDSDEIWEVHGSTWVVKHKALERVAAEQGIVWDELAKVEHDLEKKIACWMVKAKLGDRLEMDIGEAAPYNNKNGYPSAMALKRGKDRVILKLLAAHGSLYSESEADEFVQPEEAKRKNPHVTRPEDVFDEVAEIDEPKTFKKLLVKDQKPIWQAIQAEIQSTGSIEECKQYCAQLPHDERWGSVKEEWRQLLRGVAAEHLQALRVLEQGDDMRMAS